MNKEFYSILQSELLSIEEKKLLRTIKEHSQNEGAWVNLNGKKVLQFCSNDYLGLSKDKRLLDSIIEAVNTYGHGSTGSRLITGTHTPHVKLEEKLAELKKTESSLVFSCGYSANIGILSAILTEQDAVYSDELNHASIIDGIKLSKAQKYIYKHCDMEHLDEILSQNTNKHRLNIIITDSIFSMDGDRAPLKEIVNLKKKYNTVLYVDEAHSFGIYGKSGEGLLGELDLSDQAEIQMGTLSKAIGSEGGYVAGNNTLINYLINKSRSFIFSTAPSIATAAASLKAIEIIEENPKLRENFISNIKYFSEGLKDIETQKNFRLLPQDSAIFAIEFGNIEKTLKISHNLLDNYNIQAVAIRPPTVKQPVIRFTLSALHSKNDIDYLLNCLLEQ
ncbi:MAG: pyridoxal phosphate-dependent aminotransferase family protein [bacterium]